MYGRIDGNGSEELDSGMPRAASTMGLVRADMTQHLLKDHRAATAPDLLAGRVMKFHRASPLADLSYLALPGLTSRVAVKFGARVPKSVSGLGRRNASYMRLETLNKKEKELEGLSLGEDYAEETAGLTPALGKSVAVALLSSAMYGFNGANMNTQAGVQRAALGIPGSAGATGDNIWSACVSLFCIGALLGCNLSGSLADKWGRKKFLLVSAVIFAMGGILEAACALPPAPLSGPAYARIALLIVGRLVTGVACGGATVVVPMYLGEVSPAHLRGMLGTAFQLVSVMAMFAAQVLGLGSMLGTERLWPLVLGIVVVPALLQLSLGYLLVESPRWLCMVGNVEEARHTLVTLRDADPEDDAIVEEMEVMLQSAQAAKKSGKGGATFSQLLKAPTAYPLFISVCLMAVQQFSGINNAFNFSSVFLKANGMDDAAVQLIAILMNVGNVMITLLSVYLMDRAGRRVLLLMSSWGMFLAALMLTVALKSPGRTFTTPLSVLSVVLFVSAFGIGLGPVAWLLPAEIMPGETRALASSVAATTNWLANFIATQAFLVIANMLGGFAFVPFAVCLFVGSFFIAAFVPETKGKSLEQIQSELAR